MSSTHIPRGTRLIRNRKKFLFMACDVAAVLLSNALAVALRFDFDWAAFRVRTYRNVELVLLDLVLTPVIFSFCGLYQGYWKYAGLDDLVRLVRAITTRTVALIVLFYAMGFTGLSRAVLIIDTVLLLMLAGWIRLAPRFRFEFFSSRKRAAGARTLIIGAGDTGESLLRELGKNPHPEYNPIGFIDDDRDKAGVKIHGVPVLGDTGQMERIIGEYGVGEVIIAIPGASSRTRQEIFDICRRTGARFKTVPTRGELQRGAVRIGQIRSVDLEDLLGRDVVSLDRQILRQSLSGKRVLVTGAAGSIGRELARQIAAHGPSELFLVDRNENNLFYLEMELKESHPVLNPGIVIADVQDRARMLDLFTDTRPHVVFHAAAYKHVPLMEHHPLEAIKNNVVATLNLAEIANQCKVERFIYISTDKAVRPTSIMGATKHLGERLIQSLGGNGTRFMAVRFGNVLGSDGSVIPTFRKQIAAGGPVTVTHPETSRFFMTIPEAVQLVLVAGAMGDGGEVFLLQMGEPVRIVDLARNMIELSGLKPDEDIKIVFTGLRPGEKLHEELKSEREEGLPTSNQQIMILTGIEPLNESGWRQLREAESVVREGRVREALDLLRSLVPDYHPVTVADTPQGSTIAMNVVEFGAKRRVDAPAS